MADINDILEGDGEETLNLGDLDEKEVLGDDDEEEQHDHHTNGIIKVEETEDVDDLYDEAMAPSGGGTLNNESRRESAEIHSSLPSTVSPSAAQRVSSVSAAVVKAEFGTTGTSGSQSGKRYCCYIGNMTWWSTDTELQKLVQSIGVDDLVELKFYENRNNGQSKGFALAMFASEPSVKSVLEKLPNKKLHDQLLCVLPYTKQSLAKLEEATKRYDQKTQKDEKVVNIGTIRIGANGAPVPQLMSSVNLSQLARPVSGATSASMGTHQPTSLLALNFAAPPPIATRPPPTASAPGGMVNSIAPPGTSTIMASSAPSQQQQQQIAAVAAASMAASLQQQQAQQNLLLQQQRQQQQQMAAAPQMGGMSVPPPTIVGVIPQQQQVAAAAALQNAMSRPPPSMSLGAQMTSAPPPSMMSMAGATMMTAYQQQQARPMQQMQPQINTMQPPPGFPPGAHINPQVYPGFAHGVSYGMGDGSGGGGVAAMMSEAEFQEIMNRNQTVSSSAIQRAVSDAACGDYASAIETLVTAISLIRQSRVAHDDRCKLLVATLQDTLNGIEAKSYGGGGGISRKHRVRDRSRSPVRSSKRHRRSRSRSRSRDYSPIRYSGGSSGRRY